MNDENKAGKNTEEEKVSLLDVFKSVNAAFFGVQSGKNRERDFTKGKPSHYIIMGILMTVVFILLVWGAVKFALSVAGV